ncbi:MAG: CNP1-like family protein [Ramlibacter sp.]
MHLRDGLAAGLAFFCIAAAAQLTPVDPDWKELEAPPPPAFELSRLVPFDVSINSALQFGVDPATISIGRDGVVRYVIVARSSSGTITAMYEGMRCNTGEVRTYARYNASAGWARATGSEWRSMFGNAPARHTLMFARQGGCTGNAAPSSVEDIVRSLRNHDLEKRAS